MFFDQMELDYKMLQLYEVIDLLFSSSSLISYSYMKKKENQSRNNTPNQPWKHRWLASS